MQIFNPLALGAAATFFGIGLVTVETGIHTVCHSTSSVHSGEQIFSLYWFQGKADIGKIVSLHVQEEVVAVLGDRFDVIPAPLFTRFYRLDTEVLD